MARTPPTATGWYRIWTRTEVALPVVPKYLGVWVQGPGTVWVDDVSLREVIRSPLELALDQEVYDLQDRVGVLSVTVHKQPSSTELRVTLTSRGGPVLAQLVAPLQEAAGIGQVSSTVGGGALLLTSPAFDRCQAVFDASKLPPGMFEAKVELMDKQNHSLASRSVLFHRVAD